MFRYDKLEEICKKYGYLIELKRGNYNKLFVIVTYDTRCTQGKVQVGHIDFDNVITRNGVQYVTNLRLYKELTMNVESNSIKPEDWNTTDHSIYLFLVKWRLKKFRKQLDDFDSHITFLETHNKKQKANKLEMDADKDFK